LAAGLICSDDDTDSTEESDGKYDSGHDCDVDMHMENDMDGPDGIDLDSHVDMERDGDDKQQEDEEEDDEGEEDEEEEDEDEEEYKDTDDGKEPWTIGQREMVNTSSDKVDTMVDNQPIMLPGQDQKVREHTPWPQPPEPAPQPQTPEPHPRPQTPETHPHSGLENFGHLTPQKPRLAVPTLREAETSRNTLDVDMDQQLISESAGGDSLPDVPLPDVPLPDVPLPDAPAHKVRQNGSVGKE